MHYEFIIERGQHNLYINDGEGQDEAFADEIFVANGPAVIAVDNIFFVSPYSSFSIRAGDTLTVARSIVAPEGVLVKIPVGSTFTIGQDVVIADPDNLSVQQLGDGAHFSNESGADIHTDLLG